MHNLATGFDSSSVSSQQPQPRLTIRRQGDLSRVVRLRNRVQAIPLETMSIERRSCPPDGKDMAVASNGNLRVRGHAGSVSHLSPRRSCLTQHDE